MNTFAKHGEGYLAANLQSAQRSRRNAYPHLSEDLPAHATSIVPRRQAVAQALRPEAFPRRRSTNRSIRKCRSQLHSAIREFAPCGRVPQRIAMGIHQAPSSQPKPCPQQCIRSKTIIALAPPDSPCSARRESFQSRVQLDRQRLELPPPASPWVPPKTPSRATQVQRQRQSAPY